MNNETEHIFLMNSSTSKSQTVSQKVETTQINLEDVQDFSTVCRTCTTITEFVIPIFEGEGLQNNLADKIQQHLPIQVHESDKLPCVVCYQCASTLLAFHELVQCSLQAEQALRARLAHPQPQPSPAADTAETKSESEKDQNKFSAFYMIVDDALNNYLQSINMDDNGSLLYVCQNCIENPSCRNKDLAEHLQSEHSEVRDSKDVVDFIKNNLMFEETLSSDDDREVSEEPEAIEKPLPDYFCPFCESIFSSPTRLICHLNKHAQVCIETGIICCDIIYKNKKIFVQHLQEEHVNRTEESKILCRSCGHQATDQEQLQSHISEHHNNVKVKIEKDKSAINQKNIPAVCPECNKTYSNKYNMFVHMKSHEREKRQFKCEECDKSYSNRGNLSTHKKLVHEGVLQHVCSACGEAFPTRAARDVHARLHSGDRPFQCTHCPKAFRAKNTLDRHIDIHLDVRNYKCDICPKRFRKRTHLDYHLNTHKKRP